MKKLLSGNEAIAWGAYHAGVAVATAYPGTPSTEILETLASFPDIYVEWSTNEKVAMEVGLGVSYGKQRAIVSMKHVGLNVAADPFFGASVTGIRGGLVVVSADDPGIHSSQNEQDNRHYAKFAKVPMLEPSDSQEAYDLMRYAFELSERHDTPVLFRTTTRISHCKSVVELNQNYLPQRTEPQWTRDPEKLVMVPQYARLRHSLMEKRIKELASLSEDFPFNQVEIRDTRLGIVASGVAYQYAREVFPEASYFKLTISYPLPRQALRRFADSVEQVVVVEELDPYLEEALQALGIEAIGKEAFSILGELSTEAVEAGARKVGLLPQLSATQQEESPKLPGRPPVLCPGCPHTGIFYVLRRLGFHHSQYHPDVPEEQKVQRRIKREGLIVTGDIGCYTLAVYPPLASVDTTACMGASIGQAMGLERAGVRNKIVAVIGDSTFMHSGITGLLDLAYNRGTVTVIILDNGTTAMTGHQGHPGTGISARGEKVKRISPEQVARGVGIEDVHVVDAFDIKALEQAVSKCVETDQPSVMVVRGPCPLHQRVSAEPLVVDAKKCNGCSICLRLGCPAIIKEENKARIDVTLCVGSMCNRCSQICPQQAITTADKLKVGEPS